MCNCLAQNGKVICLGLSRNKALFLLCGVGDDEGADILKKGQKNLREAEISTTIVVGSAQSSLRDIGKAYHSMERTMFRLVCYGTDWVADRDVREDSVDLPGKELSSLIIHINDGDKEKICVTMEQIFRCFEGKISALVSVHLLRIALAIISHIATFSGGQNTFSYREMIEKVTEATSLTEAKKTLTQFSVEASDFITSVNSPARRVNLVEAKIVDWIHAHYCDPNLSITLIADKFGYSSRYLGRIFMHYTNTPFTRYLTALRIEKAKELVLNTDLPISRIPEATGITTLQHFYRLFKKQYGCSPAAMRKDARYHSGDG